MICCRWGLPAASKILLVQVSTLFFSQPSFRMRFSILPEGELLTGFAMRSDSEGCVTTFPCKKEIKRRGPRQRPPRVLAGSHRSV